MRILTIELSSPSAGIAMLEDDRDPVVHRWDQQQEARQHLFTSLRNRFEEASLSGIDRFIVGLGPGSFSGVRTAIACATGLALPGSRKVEGIPSVEAIASDVAEETQAERVLVIGDARRNRYWMAAYERDEDHMQVASECALYAPDEIKNTLSARTVIVSPDWSRIGATLSGICGDTYHLIREAVTPDPLTLSQLALARIEKGESLSAPEPIYLHPPVFVEPRAPRLN